MLKALLPKLVELETVLKSGRTPDDLAMIAKIWAEDISAAGETDPRLAREAIDYYRRNYQGWPAISQILEIMDHLRGPAHTQTALPAGHGDSRCECDRSQTITPGMAELAAKFLREGRSFEEFNAAQRHLQVAYAEARRSGRPWPHSAADEKKALHALFGSVAKEIPHAAT